MQPFLLMVRLGVNQLVIIYSKLPPALRCELTHRVNSNYPTLNDIFDHYNECIKTIIRSSSSAYQKRSSNPSVGKSTTNHTKSYFKPHLTNSDREDAQATLHNFKIFVEPASSISDKNINQVKPCKFYLTAGHQCTNVKSPQCRFKSEKMCRIKVVLTLHKP